ncbi:hypothetical protein CPB85DRAFT_1435693 [Mucidula mucida]|nr:hypothetical protein CPB85DRAFT_1435693 [Mucidula mucida]
MDYPYDFRAPQSSTAGSPDHHHHQNPPNLSLNLSGLSVHSQPVSPVSGKDEMLDDGMSMETSPVDGDRDTTPPDSAAGMSALGSGGGAIGVLGAGKPIPTNNFVTKLYQMISDPKSTPFISWTSLGTSFVVSSVGEFSRTILGSHFKHNNFSSFINRTPRAQRTSTDSQTWEFSHHKFLRGRPDLLEEIKRKALEPDGGIKGRIELPGEVASQLNAMRDENRRMWDTIQSERRKVERLTHMLARLSDAVGVPLGSLDDSPPPSSATTSSTSPNPSIYVSAPPPWEQPERKRPRIDTSTSWVPQHVSANGAAGSPHPHLHHQSPMGVGIPQIAHSHSNLSSPLDGVPPSKKYARARSDSAPLHHHSQSQQAYGGGGGNNTGYAQSGGNSGYWDVGRPRSGTGMRGGGMVNGNGMVGSMGGMVNISGQGQ